jgi:hypothetical protein
MEHNLMPRLDKLEHLARRHQGLLAERTQTPWPKAVMAAVWLASLLLAFAGGALLAPQLGPAAGTAAEALGRLGIPL